MTLKDRLLNRLELGAYVLEGLLRLGLISGAALAAVLGQIALALILALVAFGMLLRVWRLRRRGPRVRSES